MLLRMSIIKPLETRTVHQIQSGQVIVDLCSVVKELLENSIDAAATSIDVRFKNQGLDSVEVQDNGSGISPDSYASIALKHYTSKLHTYSDLATLQTFGFRGEALSSLCALSHLSIVTCLPDRAPRGTKLDFEPSGKLSGSHVVAAQRGTTVLVEDLFHNLPVRRCELERNIKREWTKVIALLNQYACVQTGLKVTVSQQPRKGKRVVLFSTKTNLTIRENLINVFGAKSMTSLVKLDLSLVFRPTSAPTRPGTTRTGSDSTEVCIQGYVSPPSHGEGRQTPDRQMFFVNGRPCGLPQFAKVFNDVYRSYNATQSPFVFADVRLDTHLYDVNVSPDKRTILLHDQSCLVESLREGLISLFQSQSYSIPVAQSSTPKHRLETSVIADHTDDGCSCAAHDFPPANPTSDTAPGATANGDSDPVNSCEEPLLQPGLNDCTRFARGASLPPTDSLSQSPVSRRADRTPDTGIPSSSWTKEGQQLSSHEAAGAEDHHHEPGSLSQGGGCGKAEGSLGEEHEAICQIGQPTMTPERVLDPPARPLELGRSKSADLIRGNAPAAHDEDLRREAQITAIAPLKTTWNDFHTSTFTSRLSRRRTPEIATVAIDDHSTAASSDISSKMARLQAKSVRRPVLPNNTAECFVKDSFASRLADIFSATRKLPGQPSSHSETGCLDEQGIRHADREEADYSDLLLASLSSDKSIPRAQTESCSPTFASPTGARFKDEPSTSLDGTKAREDEGEDSAPSRITRHENREPGRKRHGPAAHTRRKDATLSLSQDVTLDTGNLRQQVNSCVAHQLSVPGQQVSSMAEGEFESANADEMLSLTVSKSDFKTMTIVGQFNLGFIVTIRRAPREGDGHALGGDDELFIIDQHASDEKYNFERLQSTTVLQSQPLVYPKQLELAALDEEIVVESTAALEVNGFKVEIDDSGHKPVGSRCRLVALPLSRETTFTLSDLEELISLLGDHHGKTSSAPRPSKVRSMFAMRACRSSVMIGKALTHRQMERLVRNMGELDKPWNCPHGRPTMRHLSRLGCWRENSWAETSRRVNWVKYAGD